MLVSTRRSRGARLFVAITLAALVNAAMLAAILFQRVTVTWRPAGPTPALKLELSQPFPDMPPPQDGTLERARASPLAHLPVAPGPVPPTPPSPLQSAPAPESAMLSATANEDVQAKASAALRNLLACGDVSDPSHSNVRCGTARQGYTESIDTLSPKERAEFAADKPDMDARLARSAAMRNPLGDHGGQGSSVYYGCTLKGGHVQCSTY